LWKLSVSLSLAATRDASVITCLSVCLSLSVCVCLCWSEWPVSTDANLTFGSSKLLLMLCSRTLHWAVSTRHLRVHNHLKSFESQPSILLHSDDETRSTKWTQYWSTVFQPCSQTGRHSRRSWERADTDRCESARQRWTNTHQSSSESTDKYSSHNNRQTESDRHTDRQTDWMREDKTDWPHRHDDDECHGNHVDYTMVAMTTRWRHRLTRSACRRWRWTLTWLEVTWRRRWRQFTRVFWHGITRLTLRSNQQHTVHGYRRQNGINETTQNTTQSSNTDLL